MKSRRWGAEKPRASNGAEPPRARTGAELAAGGVLAAAGVVALVDVCGVGGFNTGLVAFRAISGPMLIMAAVLAWMITTRTALPAAARRCWRLLAVCFVLVAGGDVAAIAVTALSDRVPYPLHLPAVDAVNLVAIVLGVTAIFTIPARADGSATRLRTALDLSTVLLGAVVFLCYFSIAPDLHPGDGGLAIALQLLQNAGILVVVFAISRVTLASAIRMDRRALTLLAVATTFEALQETLYPLLRGTGWIPAAHVAALAFRALLIAAALVELRAGQRGERMQRRRRAFSVLPYTAVAGTFALLVAAMLRGVDGRTWLVLIGVIVLTGLVVARQVLAFRDNNRLLTRLDSSLTALREAVAREQVLAEMGTTLLHQRDEAAIRQIGVEAALNLLGDGSGARVTIGVRHGTTVRLLAAAGDDAASLVGAVFPADRVPSSVRADVAAGHVSSYRRSVDIGLGDLDAVPAKPGAIVLLPLTANDHSYGVLSVTADTELPDDVRKSLETLRTQVALALESAALTARLTEQALRDPLTGLANRVLLRQRVEEAATGPDARFGVLLLDLDGFKQVNDTAGHDAGDALLVTVGERIQRCMGTADLAARVGGDEFAVVVDCVDDLSRLARMVESTITEPVRLKGQSFSVGVSVGHAVWGPHVDDPDALISRADADMYRRKRQRKAT